LTNVLLLRLFWRGEKKCMRYPHVRTGICYPISSL
jgi:hypothetical protein